MKYDDASWHYGGDFPSELPKEAAATHIGMFLAWMLLRGLGSDELSEDSSAAIESLRRRELTGAQFLMKELDEKLTDQDFSTEGNDFAVAYYLGLNHDSRYFGDYIDALSSGPESLYAVADTWSNYEKLARIIDSRIREWAAAGRPKYIE